MDTNATSATTAVSTGRITNTVAFTVGTIATVAIGGFAAKVAVKQFANVLNRMKHIDATRGMVWKNSDFVKFTK